MSSLYLGADHRGWKLKESLKPKLARMGVTVHDLTPAFMPGDDYPWIAEKIAKKTAKEKSGRGLLICGSGVGMAIGANRVKGARAVEGFTSQQIKMAREDDDANVLTIGSRYISEKNAIALIKTFLGTKASTATRHVRRIKQLG